MIFVLDGGLSTQLERHHGVDLSAHPRLWTAGLLRTAEGRATLRAAHRAFANAGADIILSATYQASIEGLGVDAMRAGVDVAVSAAREATEQLGRAVVAWLSVGPFGATLANGAEYTGVYPAAFASEAALLSFHEARLHVLLGATEAGGVGGVAFETIPSVVEARALARLVASSSLLRELPCWISLQCRDGAHLADGTELAPFAAELCFILRERQTLTALGANCVSPDVADAVIEIVVRAAEESRSSQVDASTARGPLRGVCAVCVYPNAGGVWDADRKCWSSSGEPYACSHAPRWRERIERAGLVGFLGGCCATDETTVRQLRAALRAGADD